MSASSCENPIDLKIEKMIIGTEPKSMEFSELDEDAIGMIIDELKLKERFILRKVSRRLRTLTLIVICGVGYISISYNHNKIVYMDSKCFGNWKECKLIKTEDYLEMALDDLQSIFNDPTVQLDSIDVDYYPRYVHEVESIPYHIKNFSGGFKNVLMSLDHKVSTKKFSIDTIYSSTISNILPYLKPRTLEIIEFGFIVYEDLAMKQIVYSDQWRQAKELRLKHNTLLWPEEHLMNFKRFWVLEDMCLEDVLKWRNFFSKSPSFEFGKITIGFSFRPRNVQNHLGDVISTEFEDGNPMYTCHHPIGTDSNQILEIKVNPKKGHFSFTKIARLSL